MTWRVIAQKLFSNHSPYYYGQNPYNLSDRFIRITTGGDPVIDTASVVSYRARMRKLQAISRKYLPPRPSSIAFLLSGDKLRAEKLLPLLNAHL
jgi:hypothetical protein